MVARTLAGQLSLQGMADTGGYVSTAAAAEHRRKKNALDKAKANYVSRVSLMYALGVAEFVRVVVQSTEVEVAICEVEG